jgi:hypothetical protein
VHRDKKSGASQLKKFTKIKEINQLLYVGLIGFYALLLKKLVYQRGVLVPTVRDGLSLRNYIVIDAMFT